MVDNAFCSEHNMKVYHQTRRSLERMHKTISTARDHFMIQRWGSDEEPDPLPKNQQELLSKGAVYLP